MVGQMSYRKNISLDLYNGSTAVVLQTGKQMPVAYCHEETDTKFRRNKVGKNNLHWTTAIVES